MNMASRFTPAATPGHDSRRPDHGTHPQPDPLPTHDARALTGGGVQARIVLDGQTYNLRITRAGKLILTK
nr:hemin uptake protein HemP [Alkalilacustris brevis]